MKENIILFLLATLCSTSVFAKNKFTKNFCFKCVSTSISTGVLTNAESVETVLSNGVRLSQLDWAIDNSPVVNTGIRWEFLPVVSLNLNGWTTISKNGGLMNDYDWTNKNNPNELTNWSHHPRTKLNYANGFDVSFEGLLINKEDFSLGLLAGYQENRYSFTAYGGKYRYPETDDNGNFIPGSSQTVIGSFEDGKKVIGYQQKYKAPYIGLSGKYNHEKFEFGGVIKYSPWVKSYDYDDHALRNIDFYSRADQGDYYAVTIDAGYYIVPDTQLYAQYSWNKFKMNVGDMLTVDHEENTQEVSSDSAGIANKYSIVSVGIKHRF